MNETLERFFNLGERIWSDIYAARTGRDSNVLMPAGVQVVTVPTAGSTWTAGQVALVAVAVAAVAFLVLRS